MYKFIYVRDDNKKYDLIKAGYELLYKADGCWVFANKENEGGENKTFTFDKDISGGNKLVF